MIERTEYDDMFGILVAAHGWRLSEAALDAFYEVVWKAELDDFKVAFKEALTTTEEYYMPRKFVAAVRQSIDHRLRYSNTPNALPAAKYQACPDGMARLRRLVGSIRAAKGRWQCSDEQFRSQWAEPLTDEEVLKSESQSLESLISTVIGG